MNFKNRKYFTLVELIIVIAIIGVLSVSAFTIVTKWLGKSRDSRRLGEINQISKGLQTYQIENGKYPMPDMNYITLTSGTNTIGYQGYMGSGVSRIIELNKITKDPMDDKYYTYTTNLSKYQLMAMLEGSGSMNLGYGGKVQGESKKEYVQNNLSTFSLLSFNYVYAVDYSKRYPYLVGDKLGVILANTGGNTNTPVQELYNSTTFTGINLPSIDTGSYTSYVDNTTILSGTGLLQIPIYTNQSVVTPTSQESGGGSSPTNSCANTAWVSNATYLTGSPTTTNQAWQNTNSGNPCYFSCNGGYSWDGSSCVQYEISNSLRFDSSRSTYLSRTQGNGSTNKVTYSFWLKRSVVNNQHQWIYGVLDNAGDSDIVIRDNNQIYFSSNNNAYRIQSVATITDVSNWHHVVVNIDTTLSNNQMKMWLDGVQLTNFSINSQPSQGSNISIMTAGQSWIGVWQNTYRPFDGYLSEFNAIDGQALGPENFGQTIGGKRLPKAYTGTYGTNGFYLDFKDSSSLGKDVSGRNNNWTVNNHQVTDQMIDTPTNNFNIWDINNKYSSNCSLLNGGLKIGNGSFGSVGRTFGTNLISTGKWYFEISANFGTPSGSYAPYFGFVRQGYLNTSTHIGDDANSWGFSINGGGATGYKRNNSTTVSLPFTISNNSWFGVRLDADTGTFDVTPDGTNWYNIYSGMIGPFYFAYGDRGGIPDNQANFGQGGQLGLTWCADAGGYFKYCPPAGYKALSSKNF